jgi:hypothetical protein
MLLTFAIMEGVTWLTHKYVMHGFLWYLHEDHHQPTGHIFEKNDAFFLIFAIPSMACIFYGTFNGNTKGTDSYGKKMLQRYTDLINMQLSFKQILSDTSKIYLGSDATELLKKKNELDKKKASIESSLNDLQTEDVKVKLDSTIYTTVLWTILSIVLIYYVFIRL